jgi:xanthine/CO dehydrogenase XdhC/CoxF family maturation factor
VLFGAGRDAVPLAAICEGQGWDVSVVDPRRTPAPRGRFNCPVRSVDEVALDRDMLCVVMTHNLSVDREIVHGLLDSPVRYIGVLGPRRRTERILAERGASVGDVRIHAPVGLDLGAEGPAGVALSVAAELQAFVSGRCGGSLRDGHVPIHSEAALPAGVGDTPSVPSV